MISTILKNPCDVCLVQPVCRIRCDNLQKYYDRLSDIRSFSINMCGYIFSAAYLVGVPAVGILYFDAPSFIMIGVWGIFNIVMLVLALAINEDL